MIIKQILFVKMVSMSLLMSVFFAFAAVDNNDAKQVNHNTETTVKSAKADQTESTYVYTNGGVYAAPKKTQH
jgi:hypothetical protein